MDINEAVALACTRALGECAYVTVSPEAPEERGDENWPYVIELQWAKDEYEASWAQIKTVFERFGMELDSDWTVLLIARKQHKAWLGIGAVDVGDDEPRCGEHGLMLTGAFGDEERFCPLQGCGFHAEFINGKYVDVPEDETSTTPDQAWDDGPVIKAQQDAAQAAMRVVSEMFATFEVLQARLALCKEGMRYGVAPFIERSRDLAEACATYADLHAALGDKLDM